MKINDFILIFIIFSLISTALPVLANEKPPIHAAIIIDDFGGRVNGAEEFLQADIPITVAIMPFLEESTMQAEQAHERGLEVIIHLPLEPKKGKASWLGPNPITSNLSTAEVKKRVRAAIENIPHAVGLNNHMGSKILENERIMRAILEVAKEYDLYIIDSGTSSKSLIPKLADELQIPYAVNDIFLDDTYSSRQHVQKQMYKLSSIAKKKGSAIGIGHVGAKGMETVNGIKSALPNVSKEIIVLPASHLMPTTIENDPLHFWESNLHDIPRIGK